MKDLFNAFIFCDTDADNNMTFNPGRMLASLVMAAIGFIVGFFVIF